MITEYFKWSNEPMQQMHYYKVTANGTLHVNVSKAIVNLIDGAVPSLATPCEPEDFNQAITKVWEQFNAIQ